MGGDFLKETEKIKIIIRHDIKKSRLKKLLFDFLFGRFFINSLRADVVFSLQNTITFGVGKKQIVYVHQSIPFQKAKKFSFFVPEERGLAVVQHLIGRIIKLSCRYADGIVVQTRWMKEAVMAQCHVNGEKIIDALPCFESNLSSRNRKSFNNKLFIYPTSDAVYKNNELLLKACECLNDRGVTDFKIILTLPPGRYSHPNICCVGFMNPDRLWEYYGNCTLIFPSYIETVGLPLLEARSAGSLILCADTVFAHECLEGCANGYYFDFDSPERCAELMLKVIHGEVAPSAENIPHEKTMGWGNVCEFIKSFSS